MTRNKFLNIIMANITEDDFNKPVSISIRSKLGWTMAIHSPVTNILNDEGFTYISNAFSDTEDNHIFTIQRIINSLGEYKRHDFSIVFEIYSYNGKSNEQIVIVSEMSDSDIAIIKDDAVILIEILTDYIRPIYK